MLRRTRRVAIIAMFHHPHVRAWLTAVSITAAGLLVVCRTSAADPAGTLAERVAALVQRLGDDDFAVRDDARARLAELMTEPATRADVHRLLAVKLADKSTTFDVREVLRTIVPAETTLANAPDPTVAAAAPETPAPDAAEIKGLFEALDAPAFARREDAVRRLNQVAADPRSCGLLLERILRQESGKTPTIEAQRRLQSLWSVAWRTWLTSKAPAWNPPEPNDEQLTKLIDRAIKEARDTTPTASTTVVNPANPFGAVIVAEAEPPARVPLWSERELLLLLACDKLTDRVATAIKKRLNEPNLPNAAVGMLEELLAWTKPAMVAEIWKDGQLGTNPNDAASGTVQHLIVGVPNQPFGAPFPSLFDHCDDRTAHCVSGNTLTAGDYPVGVYFQPPRRADLERPGLLFHLVNLPTPRRRLAYEFEVPKQSDSVESLRQNDERRRAEITRRTVDYMLARPRILQEFEIDMFQYLDPVEASRFAEPYLMKVDDERYDSGSPQPFGNGSLHGWFCYTMTLLETPAAGRAIAKAIDAKRVLPPTDRKPYRIDWAAALMLAQFAPWPGVDEWLAAQIDRTEPLRIDEPEAADLGASAAAALLKHHEADPTAYFLEQHLFPELMDLESPGYRFTKPEGRAAVKKWWASKSSQ